MTYIKKYYQNLSLLWVTKIEPNNIIHYSALSLRHIFKFHIKLLVNPGIPKKINENSGLFMTTCRVCRAGEYNLSIVALQLYVRRFLGLRQCPKHAGPVLVSVKWERRIKTKTLGSQTTGTMDNWYHAIFDICGQLGPSSYVKVDNWYHQVFPGFSIYSMIYNLPVMILVFNNWNMFIDMT